MLALTLILAVARAGAPCPADAEALRLDDATVCARGDAARMVVLDPSGAPREAGRVEDGHRVGWWVHLDADGDVLGETRFASGSAVAGLGAPTHTPRCLEAPPLDGVYGPDPSLPRCAQPGRSGCVDPALDRPVAVLGGCIGVGDGPTGDAPQAGITGRDRFVGVHTTSGRCASGTTLAYQVSGAGIAARKEVWTACGGGATRRDAEAMLRWLAPLPASPAAAETFLADPRPAVARAALEAVATSQPAEWTCAPLAGAIRGEHGAERSERALALALAPCLVEPTRDLLIAKRQPAAALALARLEPSAARLATDLLHVVRAGDADGASALARALREREALDAPLRSALAEVLTSARVTPHERRAAHAALRHDDAAAVHGEALLAAVTRRTPCGGWSALLTLPAVQAHLAEVPPGALVATYRPLISACDLATDHATEHLLARLEALGDSAPDAAWGLLVDALEARPGPAWQRAFPDLGCDDGADPGWSRRRVEAMRLLRARRCGARDRP